MRAVKGRDTGPELAVRRMLHARGYRYRLHRKDLPGKPDMTFPSRRKVVFVHGCFWHGHSCPRGARMPKTNADYWRAKIGRNRERDEAQRAALRTPAGACSPSGSANCAARTNSPPASRRSSARARSGGGVGDHRLFTLGWPFADDRAAA